MGSMIAVLTTSRLARGCYWCSWLTIGLIATLGGKGPGVGLASSGYVFEIHLEVCSFRFDSDPIGTMIIFNTSWRG